MTRQNSAAVKSQNHSGEYKKEAIAEASNSASTIVAYSQELDTNNSIYLSAETIFLGNQSKTFVEARYYKNGAERDISTTLKPNPRLDSHLNSMEVLHHYSKLFNSVEVIYYSLDAVGQISNLGSIKSQKIGAESNPTTQPLADKIERTLKEIREENRGLYA